MPDNLRHTEDFVYMHVGLLKRFLGVVGQLCLLIFGFGWGQPAVAAGGGPGSNLIGKPLYLRGLWDKNQLDFDGAGHLLSKANPGSVALSGVDLVDAVIEWHS